MFWTRKNKLELSEISDKTTGVQLDTDKDGRALFASDIIGYINDELTRRKDERQTFELRWMLNANFLAGNQMCEINVYTNAVETYDAPYPWMEHNSYNKIAPLYDTRQANLGTVTYAMTVKPRTDETDDWEKALISTKLLQFTQDTGGFAEKMSQAKAWSELTGTAFWINWWDKEAGDDYGNGLKSGDIKYGLLTPYEVYPESVYKQKVEDQRSIIIDQIMTEDEIYDLYGVDVNGSDVDSFALTPINAGGGFGYETTAFTYNQQTVHNAAHVLTYFERKSRRYPDGRMAIAINDTMIYYGTMPYDEIPIVAQKCKETPGIFFGTSWIENVIPMQRAYNGVKNKIHDYIKTLVANTIIAEDGSIDADEFAENGAQPGGILTYRSGSTAPHPLEYDELPDTITNESYQLVNDMEYAAGVSQLMVVGSTPSGVDSGKAIENLRNIDNTRMSITAESIRNAVKRMAVIWLEMYKKFACGYRVVNIVGSNDVGSALAWCSEDINSFDIKYDTENELKLSEEQQKETFLQAYQMGLFTDDNGMVDRRFKEKALEMMKIGNYSELMGEGEQQRQNARRENSFFERGVVPEIGDFDDDETHINEHKGYALQMDFTLFKRKSPELAQLFVEHIKAHEKRKSEKANNAMMSMALQQAATQQGSEQNGSK